jgi:hypothetical protein
MVAEFRQQMTVRGSEWRRAVELVKSDGQWEYKPASATRALDSGRISRPLTSSLGVSRSA